MKTYTKNPINPRDTRTFKGKDGKKEKEKFALVPIPNTVETYVVSNYGRIFNVDKAYELEKRPLRKEDPKYLVTRINTRTDDNKVNCGSYAVNVLVANTFVKKSKRDIALNRVIVHPIDWDASNSRYCNLQWVNRTELSILKDIRDGKTEEKDYVRYVCLLLQLGYLNDDIKAVLDLPMKAKVKFINDIRQRSIYPYICVKYKY